MVKVKIAFSCVKEDEWTPQTIANVRNAVLHDVDSTQVNITATRIWCYEFLKFSRQQCASYILEAGPSRGKLYHVSHADTRLVF